MTGVTLALHRHEVLGLIGPNGAGKTTLVNLITGFDRPDTGQITLEDEVITAWSAVRRGRAGLARTFQHGQLFGGLPVRENVEVAALGTGARPRDARRRAGELLESLGLIYRQHQPAALLPHGEQRKLGVARALATRPRYVLMDEPAAGLTEPEVPSLATLIRQVRDEYETGILLVEHNMALVMEVCDRVHVLDLGRTIAEDTPERIRADLKVSDAYLGASFARRGREEARD
ncbi:MAG: ABC transporter ATP-binding protein [Solirubrobacteraceae bacterium]